MAFSFSPRRAQVLLGPVACVLLVGVLTACSGGGGTGELTTAPAVTANGEHYVYAPGTVDRSDWPKVCSLVTTASVAAALGSAVNSSSFHDRCYYVPDNDSFPTLTVTILGIGSDQQDAFDSARDDNARNSPASVDGVGKAAIAYPLPGSPTMNLDLLTDQGLFELSLRSPVGNKASAPDALAALKRVGAVLATEFAG